MGGIFIKRKNMVLVVFTLVYFSIFASLWLTDKVEETQAVTIVQIGVMSPSDQLHPKYLFIAELAQQKINAHLNKTGQNVRVHIKVRNAEGDPENAYEITKKFNEEGVKLVVGYGWNSHLNASIQYAMENSMVIVSPSANSPQYSTMDGCFRLLPDDRREAKAIADIITSYGVDSIIILQRKGVWGENMAAGFLWEIRANGGEVVDWIEYDPSNSNEIRDAISRASEMAQDSIMYRGMDKTGVFLVSLDDASSVLVEAENHMSLMNVTWFGTEMTTLDPALLSNAGHIASKVSLLGPVNTHIYNEDFQEINNLFHGAFGEPLDFRLANVYDGCWLLALSAVEAESYACVSEVFGEVAYTHYGITGPLDVNEFGDRSWIRYYFYGYYEVDGKPICLRAGSYTRLEKSGHKGSSISHSPFEVPFDNFPFYFWEKQYDSK
jgi:ABC-type branched-subunit amino acid transport system substrate-binding protein